MPETSYLRIRNNPTESEFIIVDDINNPTYTGPSQGQIWIRVRDDLDLTVLTSPPTPTQEAVVDTEWPNVQVLVYKNEIRYGAHPDTSPGEPAETSGISIAPTATYLINIDYDKGTLQIYPSN